MSTRAPARRSTATVVALAAGAALLASCQRQPDPSPPLPPPADMAEFDPMIVERIEQQVAEIGRAPEDAARWRELGALYQAHDRLELAATCYRQSLELAADEPRAHFYLALVEQQRGALDQAVAAMRRAGELASGYTPARWRLGLLLLEAGEAAAALEVLDAALALAPDDPFVHHALGRAHLQSGAADRAAAHLERWLERHPNDRYGRLLLGTAYRRLGRAGEARRQLALGHGAQPRWSDPWSEELEAKRVGFAALLDRATALLETDPGRAVERLDRLHRDRPDNATVLINLGIGQRRLGRLDESARALLEAVRLEPARGLAHFHLALTYAELSRGATESETASDLMAEALEHAERAVELQPTSPKSHAMHGELLARAGRTEAAVDAYRRALADPQDPVWLHRLGGLLCQLGKWDEAIPVLERYLERAGTDGRALYLLGVAQANAGHPEAARASLERALEVNPGEPGIRRALEQLAGSGPGDSGERR